MNRDTLVGRNSIRSDADETFRLGGESVRAEVIEVQRNLGQVLSGNFDAVHVPSIGTYIRSICLQVDQTTFTDVLIALQRNRNRRIRLLNHVHRNAGNDLASGFHLSRIRSGSVCRHCIGLGSGRSHHNSGRGGIIRISIPLVSDILVAETVEVGIQHHRSARTHILLGSIDLQVATQLINRELGRGLATILLGGRHSIDTGNCGGLNIRF